MMSMMMTRVVGYKPSKSLPFPWEVPDNIIAMILMMITVMISIITEMMMTV